jgi:hypothetical protein
MEKMSDYREEVKTGLFEEKSKNGLKYWSGYVANTPFGYPLRFTLFYNKPEDRKSAKSPPFNLIMAEAIDRKLEGNSGGGVGVQYNSEPKGRPDQDYSGQPSTNGSTDDMPF